MIALPATGFRLPIWLYEQCVTISLVGSLFPLVGFLINGLLENNFPNR